MLRHRPALAVLLTFVVTSQFTGAHAAIVHGGWTAWSELTTSCSVTCGGGVLTKMRLCTDPAPQGDGDGDGDKCKNAANEDADMEVMEFPCATESCWDLNPLWSNWTECDNCTIEPHFRYAVCEDVTCSGVQAKVEQQPCTTWKLPPECPSPCKEIAQCPKYSVCKDMSNETRPHHRCECTMGTKLEGGKCKVPPATTPTPRPIPTLPPVQKIVATAISKTASTVLIVCVSLTLVLFIMMRSFTPDRVIQMNMEIALLIAHLLLLTPSSTSEYPTFCQFISIMLHFLFTACFMFIFLEALHMYSLVAFVVKKDGMFSRTQNVFIGWGMSTFLVLFSMCFVFDEYGGEYHCWLQLDKGVSLAQQIPIYVMMIATFTLIEAAGSAEYNKLQDVNETQRTSAKFSQRTNLLILPLVYSHWLLGALSEYQQNLALYALFSTMNAILGVTVMLLHMSCNDTLRTKLKVFFGKCKGKKSNKTKPLKPKEKN